MMMVGACVIGSNSSIWRFQASALGYSLKVMMMRRSIQIIIGVNGELRCIDYYPPHRTMAHCLLMGMSRMSTMSLSTRKRRMTLRWWLKKMVRVKKKTTPLRFRGVCFFVHEKAMGYSCVKLGCIEQAFCVDGTHNEERKKNETAGSTACQTVIHLYIKSYYFYLTTKTFGVNSCANNFKLASKQEIHIVLTWWKWNVLLICRGLPKLFFPPVNHGRSVYVYGRSSS